MPKLVSSKKIFAAGVLALAVAAVIGLSLTRSLRADPKLTQSQTAAAEHWKDFFYAPSQDCMECHAAPTVARFTDPDPSIEFCLFTESAIWRAFDKHAQAYAVLEGERGKLMSKVLYNDEKAVQDPKNGCLSCHSQHNLSEDNLARGGRALDLKDAVACTGCHGPSTKKGGGGWLGDHQQKDWRKNSPEDKYHRGMRNLRDPVVRAELCMSCHIGNAAEGKVVTHAMMAAGHPPLPPMEIATFSRNEPQHWRDARNVPWLMANVNNADIAKKYDLAHRDFAQTRAALLGSFVAVRETLGLARDRAKFDAAKQQVWFPELAMPGVKERMPEKRWAEIAMAHSDCYACHHDLKFPGYRQDRGFGYYVPGLAVARVIPGRPVVRTWPLASLVPGMLYMGTKSPADLQEALNKLAEATNARPFGDPARVASSANDLAGWCNKQIGELRGASFSAPKVRALVKDVCALYVNGKNGTALPDFETARQLGSILRVACTEVGIKDDDATKVLGELNTMLNLEPYFNRPRRLDIMKKVIWEAVNPDKPDTPFTPDFTRGFDEFKAHLQALVRGEEMKKEELRKLINNDFLSKLARNVDSASFNKAVIAHSSELQKLSDEEEKKVLEAIAGYDPYAFIAALKRLSAAVK